MSVTYLPCHTDILVQDRFSILDSDDLEVPFWDILLHLLHEPVTCPSDLIQLLDTIHVLLSRPYASDYGFLQTFLNKSPISQDFFHKSWPRLVELIKRTPELFPSCSLAVLSTASPLVELSRSQSACLIAHQFFCTIPWPNWYDPEGSPDFHNWYTTDQPHADAVNAYLTALLEFFKSWNEDRTLDEHPVAYYLATSPTTDINTMILSIQCKLCPLVTTVLPEASTAIAYLGLPYGAQVISANKNIGFGRTGTQEEVNVGASPEACPAVLFTQTLRSDQILVVQGAQAMVEIVGYGRNARLGKVLETPRETWKDRTMLFMDALELDAYDGSVQVPDLLDDHLQREIRKAFTAFAASEVMRRDPFEKIMTGLWGCRSFCGDEQVKTLLQWIATSLAGVSELNFVVTQESMEFSTALEAFGSWARGNDVGLDDIWTQLRKVDARDVRRGRSMFKTIQDSLGG